jgi:hypothetical protein
MVAIELLETALKSGKELYDFAQGGEFYLLLNELAGIEGQAASRAIDDARKSKYPRDQLNQAEAILRLAYEKYSKAARPSFFHNVVSAVVEPSGPLKSRNKILLNAATTALTAAEVTRLASNPPMRRAWLDRAQQDFDLYITRAKPRYERPVEPKTRMDQDGWEIYLNLKPLYDMFDNNVRSFNAAYRAHESLPDIERVPDL